MQERHKARVLHQLDEVRPFLIRDVVNYVVEALAVSHCTICTYLRGIRWAVEDDSRASPKGRQPR
jgi:predicted transcriptional regulator YheO